MDMAYFLSLEDFIWRQLLNSNLPLTSLMTWLLVLKRRVRHLCETAASWVDELLVQIFCGNSIHDGELIDNIFLEVRSSFLYIYSGPVPAKRVGRCAAIESLVRGNMIKLDWLWVIYRRLESRSISRALALTSSVFDPRWRGSISIIRKKVVCRAWPHVAQVAPSLIDQSFDLSF